MKSSKQGVSGRMKIVINRCVGGFGLSEKAYEFLNIPWDGYGYKYSEESKRTDPELVRCVEELGEEANGSFAKLEVIEIPDDVIWMITDYDGIEQVEEARSVWR